MVFVHACTHNCSAVNLGGKERGGRKKGKKRKNSGNILVLCTLEDGKCIADSQEAS